MSCRVLTTLQGTKIVAPALATEQHTPFACRYDSSYSEYYSNQRDISLTIFHSQFEILEEKSFAVIKL